MNTVKKALIIIIILLTLVAIIGFIIAKNSQENSSNEKVNLNPSAKITPTEIVTITLTENGFDPNEISITPNTKVVWINNSGQFATVDSNPHPIHTENSEMNLGEFGDGEKLELIFPKTGEFNFHNHYNSEQGGRVTVQ